jgi:hypothetical protein
LGLFVGVLQWLLIESCLDAYIMIMNMLHILHMYNIYILYNIQICIKRILVIYFDNVLSVLSDQMFVSKSFLLLNRQCTCIDMNWHCDMHWLQIPTQVAISNGK